MNIENVKLLRDWHAAHVVPFDMRHPRAYLAGDKLVEHKTLPGGVKMLAPGSYGSALGYAPEVPKLLPPRYYGESRSPWLDYGLYTFDLRHQEYLFLFSSEYAKDPATNTQADFIARATALLEGTQVCTLTNWQQERGMKK